MIVEGVHSFAMGADIRVFLDAPEEFLRAARRSRDERLGVTDEHWNRRWTMHYEAYRRFVLPHREQANIIITLSAERISIAEHVA